MPVFQDLIYFKDNLTSIEDYYARLCKFIGKDKGNYFYLLGVIHVPMVINKTE